MKSLLLLMGMLVFAALPANAGVHVSFSGGSVHGSFNVGGGYNGGYHSGFCASTGGGRCSYAANCYGYRNCNYGYNYPYYGGYAYYGGYLPAIYDGYSYDSYVQPVPSPVPESVPPPQTIAPAPAVSASAPAPAPMEFGILDVNGFVHSPYSDAIFKVPGVRNAQMVYDPVTGKPFLVR